MGHGSTGVQLSKAQENPFAKEQAATPPKAFDTSTIQQATAGQREAGDFGTNDYDKVLAYLMQMGQRR